MASKSLESANETRRRMVPDEAGETGRGQITAMVKIVVILRVMINHLKGLKQERLRDLPLKRSLWLVLK